MSNEGSAHDTLRWGDTLVVPNLATLNATETSPSSSFTKQLVAAHWRWPLVWVCHLVVQPNLQGETQTFLINLLLNLGCGQGVIPFTRQYTLAPPYTALTGPSTITDLSDTFQLPGQDIQAQVSVSTVGNDQPTGSTAQALTIGFFVAPLTEPHAMTLMHDKIVHGEGPQPAQWMDGQTGFHPEPLRYRGRGG